MNLQRAEVVGGEEHVEPTPRGQRALLAVFAVGFGFALALLALWPLLMAHVRALPVCEQLDWFRILVGVQGLLMAAIPGGLFALGRAVRRSGRWPPPRWLVLRRTRVRRGAPAQRRAGWLIAAAAVTGLACTLLVATLMTLIADVAARWQC